MVTKTKKLPTGMWKRGNTYWSRFRKGAKLVRKRLSTDFDTAKQILNEMRVRADKGDHGIVDNGYRWNDLKAEFLRSPKMKKKPRKVADYVRHLSRFEEYCPVASVHNLNHAYVRGFIEWREGQGIRVHGKKTPGGRSAGREISPRTVNKEIGALRAMLRWGVKAKLIGSNPIDGCEMLEDDEPRKQRRALTLEQAEAIFDKSPAYLRPVFRLLAMTGMRRNEAVTLLFSDIDFGARELTIRKVNTKGKKTRTIPLDDETVATLKELQSRAAERQPVSPHIGKFSRDHVFVTAANTPLKNNLLRAFYAVCKRAGIKDAVPGGAIDLHSLRVTFATLVLEGGATPKNVQALLGHSTLELTMKTYAKATGSGNRAAIDCLPFKSSCSTKCDTPSATESQAVSQ